MTWNKKSVLRKMVSSSLDLVLLTVGHLVRNKRLAKETDLKSVQGSGTNLEGNGFSDRNLRNVVTKEARHP